ncbi:MAG: phosphate signaling complex protein PhoU [Deltaproteobacteria bacterium]|nr:phosphate signaling complex protein PhoU [Deltaproteobacteria bacterium]
MTARLNHQHTDKRYEEGLQHLKAEILKMGGLVDAMIGQAMRALTQRDLEIARQVRSSESEVNALEMAIDDLALELLALHQPAASDLRFLTMGFRISKDLERMGDLAVNLAERAEMLANEHPLSPSVDLPQLGVVVQKMTHESLDAFVHRDAALAKAVCEMDDAADSCNRRLFADLTTLIQQQPDTALRAINLVLAARDLERIADHATNIAEEVIFMVEGRDIRHGQT